MQRIWTAFFILLGLSLAGVGHQCRADLSGRGAVGHNRRNVAIFVCRGQHRTTLWIENYCTATSQNITTPESLFVYFLPTGTAAPTTASGPSLGAFELAACGSQVFADQYMTKQAVYVLGATTGHQFTGWASQ